MKKLVSNKQLMHIELIPGAKFKLLKLPEKPDWESQSSQT